MRNGTGPPNFCVIAVDRKRDHEPKDHILNSDTRPEQLGYEATFPNVKSSPGQNPNYLDAFFISCFPFSLERFPTQLPYGPAVNHVC